MNFKIVIPVYNAEQWIERCIDSVLSQTYKKFDLIIIDDHSTDNTWNLIKKYPCFSLSNPERLGSGLANIAKGIQMLSHDPEDIIITVDGDDKLSDQYVLSYLNEVYKEDVWMTYGSFLPESGNYSGTCQDLSHTRTVDESGNWVDNYLTPATYRQSKVWVTSHLRTFKNWLWYRIKDEDLRDENGYFKVAWDLAFMYPMIEMADTHVKFIDRILYIYNDLTELSDGKIHKDEQLKITRLIQDKPKYETIK